VSQPVLTEEAKGVRNAGICPSAFRALEATMTVEKLPAGANAAGLAAYDLVQKLFLLLIERGALSVHDAQVILRDSIETHLGIMDEQWAPLNEAAAHLLTRLSEAVERQHGNAPGPS
jgi:hypothetical protein